MVKFTVKKMSLAITNIRKQKKYFFASKQFLMSFDLIIFLIFNRCNCVLWQKLIDRKYITKV